MKKLLPQIVGNDTLRTRLGAELAEGRLSHAYIIEGPKGSGKRTLALQLAMALSCEQKSAPNGTLPCGVCNTCRKLKEGISPDLFYVRAPEGKATIGVETVRALREKLSLVPNDLDTKIYIIENAHTMNEQAQNALLLTLEEPPPFVLFLLLAENAQALLETIRSRAPVFRMQPIPASQISEHLQSEEVDRQIATAARRLQSESPAEYATLLNLADGRIGAAIDLLSAGTRAPLLARQKSAEELCRLLAERTAGEALLLHLLSFGKNREEITGQLLFFKRALRDLLALSFCEKATLLFFADAETAADLAAKFPHTRLFDLVAATDEALASLSANANTRLTLARFLDRATK